MNYSKIIFYAWMRGHTYSLNTENTGFVFLFIDSQGSYFASVEKIILGGWDAITGVILNGIPGAIFRRSRRRPRRHFQEFQTVFQTSLSGIPDAGEKCNLHAMLRRF